MREKYTCSDKRMASVCGRPAENAVFQLPLSAARTGKNTADTYQPSCPVGTS